MEVAQNELFHHLGGLGEAQHAAECGCKGQHECQTAVGFYRSGQEAHQIAYFNALVNEQRNQNGVEHRNHSGLGGGEEAGVNAAQNDHGAQQSGQAFQEQGHKAVGTQLVHFCLDTAAVFALGHAVEHGVNHQEGTDHDAGEHAAQEQIARGNAGGQRIQNKRNAGGNDNAQTACNRDQTGCPGFIITQIDHKGNAHGTHSGGGGGAGAGNSAVEQAGEDNGTGHAAGDLAYKVSKEVKQLAGNAALRHDHAAQNEQGNSQNGGGVCAREGVVQQLLNGAALAHGENGSKGAHDHGNADGHGTGDAYQKYDKYK